jgi:hypothetical protein
MVYTFEFLYRLISARRGRKAHHVGAWRLRVEPDPARSRDEAGPEPECTGDSDDEATVPIRLPIGGRE